MRVCVHALMCDNNKEKKNKRKHNLTRNVWGFTSITELLNLSGEHFAEKTQQHTTPTSAQNHMMLQFLITPHTYKYIAHHFAQLMVCGSLSPGHKHLIRHVSCF